MYLQQHNADVSVADDPDRAEYRAQVGIPDDAASCHTAMIDGYAIEGHVPVGAIVTLLETRPDAVGLAVPGMPGDSPGMGGNPTTWEAQSVLLVGHDGALAPFEY